MGLDNDRSVSNKGFIVVKNPKNGKKIKTFKRTMDDNYIKTYNLKTITKNINISGDANYLVINEYYRELLEIPKNEIVELEIAKATFFQKIFLIHWTHPNPTIQFANRATLISILIGIIALLLTIYSTYITLRPSIPSH